MRLVILSISSSFFRRPSESALESLFSRSSSNFFVRSISSRASLRLDLESCLQDLLALFSIRRTKVAGKRMSVHPDAIPWQWHGSSRVQHPANPSTLPATLAVSLASGLGIDRITLDLFTVAFHLKRLVTLT